MLDTELERATVCPDCGGTLIDSDDYSVCEFFEDTGVWHGYGVVGCGFADTTVAAAIVGSDCLHGLPAETCAICLGRWDGRIRDGAGRVRSGPDLISWFVPSALGHDRKAHPVAESHLGRSGNGCPSSALPVSSTAPAGPVLVGNVSDWGTVGRPDDIGTVDPERQRAQRAAAANWGGFDYYGFSLEGVEVGGTVFDQALAALRALLEQRNPVRVEVPPVRLSGVGVREGRALYGAAVAAVRYGPEVVRERLREWRDATGRSEGAAAAHRAANWADWERELAGGAA